MLGLDNVEVGLIIFVNSDSVIVSPEQIVKDPFVPAFGGITIVTVTTLLFTVEHVPFDTTAL